MKKRILILSLIATVGFSADVILGRLQDLTWTGTGADRVASFATETPDVLDGLVAWWKMDEASWNGTAGEVMDSVAGNYNGVSVGGATTTNGLLAIGRSGLFNGSTSYVNTGANLNPSNQMTISCWIKTTDNSLAIQGILCKRTTGLCWQFGLVGDTIIFTVYQSDGTPIESERLSSFANNTLYHYVAVANGTQTIIYINGVVVGAPQSYNGTIKTDNTSNVLIADLANYRFKGQIDDVRVYDRGLSATEINTIYNKFKP